MAHVIVVIEFLEKTRLGMESPVQKVEADNDQLLVDRAAWVIATLLTSWF